MKNQEAAEKMKAAEFVNVEIVTSGMGWVQGDRPDGANVDWNEDDGWAVNMEECDEHTALFGTGGSDGTDWNRSLRNASGNVKI